MDSPFDRCGFAALADLETNRARELFAALDRVQSDFLAQEAKFRSDDYPWPRDALRNWSRVWEYPYVHHHVLAERRREDRALRILDVGSGVAFFPFANARADNEVICVDNDPRCVRDMSRAIEGVDASPGRVEMRQSGGRDVAVADAWADLALSVSVLEHVEDPPALVEAMARALRPGGLCILTMDLDLRGDGQIDAAGRDAIHAAVDRHFDPAHATRNVHPRDLLQSTNGPYGFRLPPAGALLRFRSKQWLRGLVGLPRKPIYPFELAVEALVLRKR